MAWRSSSIRGRLVRALALWSVLWCLALGVALWFVVQEEVEELLDDSLQSAAEGLIGPLALNVNVLARPRAASSAPASLNRRFTWQLVSHRHGAEIVAAADTAPRTPMHTAPKAAFSDVPGWRVFGMSSGRDGQMLYVAQSREERLEIGFEMAMAVLLTGAPMALLAMLWLNARARREMQPLQDLSLRLTNYDPLMPGASLGPAVRDELIPVHAAINALADRLTRRIAHERAFTSHAAHALRTPLAGIDAQLAVALREEASEPVRARLHRVRTAADRLQRVVIALLTMFRSGAEVVRTHIDLNELVARLAVQDLVTVADESLGLSADADLLTAAVLNLVDNAVRHGGGTVTLSTPAPNVLRVHDDGPGVDSARRSVLQQAIDTQDYAGRTGLGLMLADLVARAHDGSLVLPEEAVGFAAVLRLGPEREDETRA